MRRRKPASKKSPSEWQPSAKTQPEAYAKVCIGHILVPVEHLALLASWVKIDYDYKDGEYLWKLPKRKSNDINVEIVDRDWLTALEVAQKLEG